MTEIFEQDNFFNDLSSSSEIKKLNTNEVEMQQINWKTASAVIEEKHYSHVAPTSQMNFGFYINGTLSTVIMYSQGANCNASDMVGGKKKDIVELVRLFSYDWAPKNIESHCISRSLNWLEKNTNVKFVVSYADFNHNHVGYIYQASNWLYTGLGSKGKIELYVDGKLIHAKSIYEEVGTNKRKEVEEFYKKQGKTIEWIPVKAKARYIYILGNKREKKKRRKKIAVPIFDKYPKSYEDALQMEEEGV
jgi:hypothetical protein